MSSNLLPFRCCKCRTIVMTYYRHAERFVCSTCMAKERKRGAKPNYTESMSDKEFLTLLKLKMHQMRIPG